MVIIGVRSKGIGRLIWWQCGWGCAEVAGGGGGVWNACFAEGIRRFSGGRCGNLLFHVERLRGWCLRQGASTLARRPALLAARLASYLEGVGVAVRGSRSAPLLAPCIDDVPRGTFSVWRCTDGPGSTDPESLEAGSPEVRIPARSKY